MTDVAPPAPGFYLTQAETDARNVRAWIGRYSKIHPEPREPGYDEFISNRVSWVVGVLDALELHLHRATESVNYHLPRHQPATRSPEASLNIHRLRTLNKLAGEIGTWAHAVRWSNGKNLAAELVRLEATARNIADNVGHLLAQAEETELAR